MKEDGEEVKQSLFSSAFYNLYVTRNKKCLFLKSLF